MTVLYGLVIVSVLMSFCVVAFLMGASDEHNNP